MLPESQVATPRIFIFRGNYLCMPCLVFLILWQASREQPDAGHAILNYSSHISRERGSPKRHMQVIVCDAGQRLGCDAGFVGVVVLAVVLASPP